MTGKLIGYRRKSKYNAIGVWDDNIYFPSTGENKRYKMLKMLEKAGEISELKVHQVFILQESFKNGKNEVVKKETLNIDFIYKNKNGDQIYEDFKGMLTKDFKIKKALFEKRYFPATIKITTRRDN